MRACRYTYNINPHIGTNTLHLPTQGITLIHFSHFSLALALSDQATQCVLVQAVCVRNLQDPGAVASVLPKAAALLLGIIRKNAFVLQPKDDEQKND